MTSSAPDLDVGPLLRKLAPHVLGAVIRRFRDFAASEDAVQEARAHDGRDRDDEFGTGAASRRPVE
jgi:hypothetical protein